MRRAAIEVQFNWIFVMIVGAMILLFFTTAILRQKSVSEARIASIILTDLETITTGAKVSRSTEQIIEMPDTKVEFSCDDCLCKFSIGKSSKPFRDKVIFAPSYIKGREVIAWTQEFNFPFRASNMLFLTSPQLRYIIINPGGNALGVRINQALPDSVIHEYNPDEIGNINSYKVRFVYVDSSPNDNDVSALSRMPDRDVTAVELHPATREISFYKKSGSSWDGVYGTSYWLSPTGEDVFGAVFAEDLEMYSCQSRELYKRLDIAAQVYERKAGQLRDYFGSITSGSQADCRLYYDPALLSLATISNWASQLSQSFDSVPPELSAASDSLIQQNNGIMLRHCPEIY